MQDNGNQGSLSGVGLLAAAVLAMIVKEKLYPLMLAWLVPVEHRVGVVVLASFVTCVFLERLVSKWKTAFVKRAREKAVLGRGDDAVFCGESLEREKVFIKTRQRVMHTQVIGTTNAGKTESVILPWAIQDMAQKRGLILIDGKADRTLLDKLYAYAVKCGRKKDFKLFSISNIKESHQFNPLVGGTSEEIAERVFNAFEFDNPYYRSVQFEIFAQVLRIFHAAGKIPTFQRLHEGISDPDRLAGLLTGKDQELSQWLSEFTKLGEVERGKRTSGLTAALSHFAFGNPACLYNTEKPTIHLDKALEKNHIIYFQLPVLLSPFLGRATGKLVLQALQSAIAKRHKSNEKEKPEFFSVFLDDFTEYLYPGFVSILNKSRSANIGVVFAHQALGDIKTLGEPIANSILTNSNLKIFMRGSDPESAEYYSRVIGTKEAMKFTERTKRELGGRNFTGDSSAREVEEFIVHPNRFKSSLGVGEAVVVIPHENGAKCVQMKFQKFDDIPSQKLSLRKKAISSGLAPAEQSQNHPERKNVYGR